MEASVSVSAHEVELAPRPNTISDAPAREVSEDELESMSYETLVDIVEGYFGIDPFEGGGRPTKEDLVRTLRSFSS